MHWNLCLIDLYFILSFFKLLNLLKSEDFSKHHEEGLLEALHRSMENFESSTMSDLASLSSSLGITHPSDDLSLPVSTGGGFMDSMMMTDQLSTGAGNTTPLQSPEEEEIVSVDEQVDMDEEKSDANESVVRVKKHFLSINRWDVPQGKLLGLAE